MAQLIAHRIWETYPTHSGLFSKTSNTPLTLRIFGLWDFRKNRQKWQRPHSIPQTLKTPQKLNIGMWRSLVSRSLWEREISQVRILSSRPPFLRSLAVPEDYFFFFDYCGSNFDGITSKRHGFLRGVAVSALRRLSCFEPFLLGGNFCIHLRDQLGELFFAFLSCLCVYIFRCAFSVCVCR